jgi:hypothetical protein
MNRARQRGAVAVELALVALPLSVILFGMLELGRAFYQYDTIVKSTRSAARYISVQAAGIGIPQAQCLVVAGTTDTGNCGTPLLAGLNANMVTVRYYDGVSTCPAGATKGCGSINLVEVCVNCAESLEKYQFVSIAKLFVSDITFGQIRAVARREGA